MNSHQKRYLVTGSISLVVVAVALGWASLRSHAAPDVPHRSKAAGTHLDTSVASQNQHASTDFQYPPSRGSTPDSIKITYDDVHDRTRMTIELRLTLSNAGPYRPSGAKLTLTSEFHGRVRPTDFYELSAAGLLSVNTSKPGLLACSKPGVFLCDATPYATRFSTSSKAPYSSKKISQVYHESLRFKLDTANLLKLAQSSIAQGAFGAAEFKLSAAQLADLREFAARMNPNPN